MGCQSEQHEEGIHGCRVTWHRSSEHVSMCVCVCPCESHMENQNPNNEAGTYTCEQPTWAVRAFSTVRRA